MVSGSLHPLKKLLRLDEPVSFALTDMSSFCAQGVEVQRPQGPVASLLRPPRFGVLHRGVTGVCKRTWLQPSIRPL
jgi:hypothetical protein